MPEDAQQQLLQQIGIQSQMQPSLEMQNKQETTPPQGVQVGQETQTQQPVNKME